MTRPYPQYSWDFPEEILEEFRKDPGNALRVFPGILLESTAGNSQALSFTDLFLRRFREGISFPKSLERSILRLPLSKPAAVPFALQNRALFEGEKRAERRRE